jgi:hypothetical protein
VTDPSIATGAEMLAAVERWARVREMWRSDGQSLAFKRGEWEARCTDSRTRIMLWWHGDRTDSWFAEPAVALAWAILVESEPAPVDVGACPECKAQGVQEREYRPPPQASFAAQLLAEGWEHTGGTFRVDDWSPSDIYQRQCPACSGSGRKLAPVPRLLLDAATDPAARAEPLTHADRLANSGDTRCEVLTWALALLLDGDHRWTATAVRWLEWLTWGREFERGRQEAESQRRNGHLQPSGPGTPEYIHGHISMWLADSAEGNTVEFEITESGVAHLRVGFRCEHSVGLVREIIERACYESAPAGVHVEIVDLAPNRSVA